MQKREKLLIAGLLVAVLLWRGWPIAHRLLFGAIEAKQAELTSLQNQIQQKKTSQLELIRATARMKNWRDASLPRKPLDAQRLYQEWLTDLAEQSGWTRAKITPQNRAVQGDIYTAVSVQVHASPTFEQLLTFLYNFHRTNLLHRVTKLSIARPVQDRSGALDVTLIAEGVALNNAEDRETLFPSTKLVDDLGSSATMLKVDDAKRARHLPFLVRIGSESGNVLKVEGNQWTVERGVEGTSRDRHSKGDVVEVIPIGGPLAKKTLADYRKAFNGSLFQPYRETPPRLLAVRPQDAYFGRTLQFRVRATDADGSTDQLRFSMRSAPRGASLDPRTGEFRWTPDTSLSPRRYSFTVQVRDGGSPPQTASIQVSVNLHQDPAQATVLTAAMATNDWSEAILHNEQQNQMIIVHRGDVLRIADISGEIVDITNDCVLLKGEDGTVYQLKMGANLRNMQRVPAPASAEAPAEASTETPTQAPAGAPAEAPAEAPAADGKAPVGDEGKPPKAEPPKTEPQDQQAPATDQQPQPPKTPAAGDEPVAVRSERPRVVS